MGKNYLGGIVKSMLPRAVAFRDQVRLGLEPVLHLVTVFGTLGQLRRRRLWARGGYLFLFLGRCVMFHKIGEGPSNSAQQQQDQQDDRDQAESAARIIAPVPTVRPSRPGAEQHEDEDNQQNSS